ncbi:uncharacterized protein si:dkey-29d8.3 isoform X2 [Phyllopteryx taeniolatus]|uniref:uncharacterized protein si:dkey-29d8.3 isoform X2 n=1 Tax=Phyllopteryx taeniolatus TaxID=161469 RepID=UPI002AD2163B|nr:uncharacterized protein si:dkey-29d8.3 isoform X2 [Phyllopteryx taeniolatus]
MRDIVVPRIFVIVLCAVVFVAVLVVNGFAGAGRGSFHSSTGNVSARYETDITPAGWTFSIWGVIYTWLSLMVIYITLYVFRGSWAHCLLPYAFYFFWLFNMVLNMIWLLLWDREMFFISGKLDFLFISETLPSAGLGKAMSNKSIAFAKTKKQRSLTLHLTKCGG